MNSKLNQNNIQSPNEETNVQIFFDNGTVKVRFNGNKYIEVNKQKLLESSPYFQNMLSSCFKDHKTEYVEVNYPGSFETFERSMQFVNNGDVVLSDENGFNTFELADYLQMDNLQKRCLDQFTSSLTRDNVLTKFNLLESLNFPVKEFKQRAFNFVENQFSGLYYIRSKTYDQPTSVLKYFSEENNTFRSTGCNYGEDSVQLDLHYINNTLIMCPTRAPVNYVERNMVMYDLITGKTNETKLNFEGSAVSCSNEINMFIVSVAQENSEKKMYIEILDIKNYNHFRSTKETVDSSLIAANKISYFYFAHFFEDKIYLFYKAADSMNNYMMIVCTKTKRITGNINLANNDLFRDDTTIDDHCRNLISRSDLSKLFHYEKENKLFIKLNDTSVIYAMDEFSHILVFDITNQHFYVKEDMVQLNEEIYEDVLNLKIATKGDKLYTLFTFCKLDPDFDDDDEKNSTIWEEIRKFKFEKEHLADKGLLWRSGERRVAQNEFMLFPLVTSAIFVQNVKLY